MSKPQQANTGDVIQVRYDKLDALREAGRDPFVITTSDRDTYTEDIKNSFEEFENKDVCVAGRIMSKRGKGKVSFLDLHDKTGKIQIFAKFDDLGEEEYGFLKKWDIGDIVEVKGFVFKTQMGEVSVHAKAEGDIAWQVPADSAREISRTHQHRPALPSALRRPDYEPRRKGHFCQAL